MQFSTFIMAGFAVFCTSKRAEDTVVSPSTACFFHSDTIV